MVPFFKIRQFSEVHFVLNFNVGSNVYWEIMESNTIVPADPSDETNISKDKYYESLHSAREKEGD